MNCYNGEEFLREAIESVYAQSYQNWEIIFVDNCSIDSSTEIAQSYGDKVKYVKTPENIPLGAARNFGMEFCTGEYIAFLDCDDVWLPSMLAKQKDAIESGDYALAYAGQVDVDKDGKEIGRTIPRYKKGNIFGELLTQYDVPLVTSMIRRSKLEESKLNFDLNVSGSEEYCLFMQLAVSNQFVVIPEALVRYRVLSNSLTAKTLSVRGDERRYTLDTIIRNHSGIASKFPEGFREAYARGCYYEAQYAVAVGDKVKARSLMAQIKQDGLVYYVLYLSLFLPAGIWDAVQKFKYGR